MTQDEQRLLQIIELTPSPPPTWEGLSFQFNFRSEGWNHAVKLLQADRAHYLQRLNARTLDAAARLLTLAGRANDADFVLNYRASRFPVAQEPRPLDV